MEDVVCADFDNYPPLHPTTVRNNKRRSNATEYVVLDAKHQKLLEEHRKLRQSLADAEHDLLMLRASMAPLVRALDSQSHHIVKKSPFCCHISSRLCDTYFHDDGWGIIFIVVRRFVWTKYRNGETACHHNPSLNP